MIYWKGRQYLLPTLGQYASVSNSVPAARTQSHDTTSSPTAVKYIRKFKKSRVMNGTRASFAVSFARNRGANDKLQIHPASTARLVHLARFIVLGFLAFLKSFRDLRLTSYIDLLLGPPRVLARNLKFPRHSRAIAALCRREIVKLENAVIALPAIASHSSRRLRSRNLPRRRLAINRE